jgi:hypothetical protein
MRPSLYTILLIPSVEILHLLVQTIEHEKCKKKSMGLLLSMRSFVP